MVLVRLGRRWPGLLMLDALPTLVQMPLLLLMLAVVHHLNYSLMLLAILFLLVVLDDEDVLVLHQYSFAGLGQGRDHSPLVVVAVVVAAVVVAAVVVAAVVVAAVVVAAVAVEIHEQRNGLGQDYTFLGGRMLHWHSFGPFVQVYFEE